MGMIRSPMRTSPRSTTTVGLVDRLEPRRHRPDLGLDVAAGEEDRVAHEHGRSARRRLLVVRHDGGVAHHDRHPVERRAELLGGDLGEDRARALAHVGGARVDDDAAVGEQPDGRVGEPGRRPGLQPDREAATATRRRRAPPPDQLGRAPDGPRPVAVGRRVAGDEGVAAAGQVAQPELERDRCRGARAASSMFDSTAQICCGLPKPRKAVDGVVCDRMLRATIRTAGTGTARSTV